MDAPGGKPQSILVISCQSNPREGGGRYLNCKASPDVVVLSSTQPSAQCNGTATGNAAVSFAIVSSHLLAGRIGRRSL